MRHSVLMIEDDHDAAAIAEYFLTSAGFHFDRAAEGLEGLKRVQQKAPDLIILDLSLPDIDGTEVFRHIRERRDTPIVILTGHDSDDEMLAHFSEGADDYIKKPASAPELVARVQAVLRRCRPDLLQEEPERILAHGDLILDRVNCRVIVSGKPRHLTATEIRLMALLLTEPGRIVSRAKITWAIHSNPFARDSRTVDSHISHLRRKLQSASDGKQSIENVYGMGYRLTL